MSPRPTAPRPDDLIPIAPSATPPDGYPERVPFIPNLAASYLVTPDAEICAWDWPIEGWESERGRHPMADVFAASNDADLEIVRDRIAIVHEIAVGMGWSMVDAVTSAHPLRGVMNLYTRDSAQLVVSAMVMNGVVEASAAWHRVPIAFRRDSGDTATARSAS